MKRVIKFGSILLAGMVLSQANADEQAVRKALSQSIPDAKPDLIAPSDVKGLYEVMIGTNIFYVTDDGKYLIQGKIYDVEARKDISEEKIAGARIKAIGDVSNDQMIVFKPEKSKHTVTIFTDVDCGYCRKLHSEIDDYLEEGITIQYLLFPRAGKGSDSYKKSVSVWCAEDRNKALTLTKKGQIPEEKECDNPVDEHMALGQQLNVTGTPMMVTEKGTVFPGYIPAKNLSKALNDDKTGG